MHKYIRIHTAIQYAVVVVAMEDFLLLIFLLLIFLSLLMIFLQRMNRLSVLEKIDEQEGFKLFGTTDSREPENAAEILEEREQKLLFYESTELGRASNLRKSLDWDSGFFTSAAVSEKIDEQEGFKLFGTTDSREPENAAEILEEREQKLLFYESAELGRASNLRKSLDWDSGFFTSAAVSEKIDEQEGFKLFGTTDSREPESAAEILEEREQKLLFYESTELGRASNLRKSLDWDSGFFTSAVSEKIDEQEGFKLFGTTDSREPENAAEILEEREQKLLFYESAELGRASNLRKSLDWDSGFFTSAAVSEKIDEQEGFKLFGTTDSREPENAAEILEKRVQKLLFYESTELGRASSLRKSLDWESGFFASAAVSEKIDGQEGFKLFGTTDSREPENAAEILEEREQKLLFYESTELGRASNLRKSLDWDSGFFTSAGLLDPEELFLINKGFEKAEAHLLPEVQDDLCRWRYADSESTLDSDDFSLDSNQSTEVDLFEGIRASIEKSNICQSGVGEDHKRDTHLVSEKINEQEGFKLFGTTDSLEPENAVEILEEREQKLLFYESTELGRASNLRKSLDWDSGFFTSAGVLDPEELFVINKGFERAEAHLLPEVQDDLCRWRYADSESTLDSNDFSLDSNQSTEVDLFEGIRASIEKSNICQSGVGEAHKRDTHSVLEKIDEQEGFKLFGITDSCEPENAVEILEEREQKLLFYESTELGRVSNLRKSLDWDSGFFSSAGVLDPEELFVINKGFEKAEAHLLPEVQEDLCRWRYADSKSTLDSDDFSLDSNQSTEVDLFEGIRASIGKSNITSNICKSGVGEGHKRDTHSVSKKIDEQEGFKLFGTTYSREPENAVEILEEREQKLLFYESTELGRASNLRKSLDWDSGFFTSAGLLDPEELFLINKGFEKAEAHLLPEVQEDLCRWRYADSESTLDSDDFSLDSNQSTEVDLFEGIRASIEKSNIKSDICKSGVGEGHKRDTHSVSEKIDEQEGFKLFGTADSREPENAVEILEEREQKLLFYESTELGRASNLRKSLDWDSGFFTSAGLLDPEELFVMNKGFEMAEAHLLPEVQDDLCRWRYADSESTLDSDDFSLDSNQSTEVDWFEGIRASIEKYNIMSNICKSGVGEDHKRDTHLVSEKIDEQEGFKLFGTTDSREPENAVEILEEREQKLLFYESTELGRASNLRKSLDWDSGFFTSAGLLDPEELFVINKGFERAEAHLLPEVQEDLCRWRYADSESTLDSDDFSLDSNQSTEVDWFEGIRASIEKSNIM